MRPKKYPYLGRRKKQEKPSPIFSARPIFNEVPIVEEVKVEFGVEAIEVVKNFAFGLEGVEGFYWGNAIKYMLRFQKKNGLEDLKKARKNLDWLIEEMEHEN